MDELAVGFESKSRGGDEIDLGWTRWRRGLRRAVESLSNLKEKTRSASSGGVGVLALSSDCEIEGGFGDRERGEV